MQWIESPIDHHDPVLARLSVWRTAIEILDHGQLGTRKLRYCGGKLIESFHSQKVISSVMAWGSQQKRELKATMGQCRSGARSSQQLPRQGHGFRSDDPGYGGKTPPNVATASPQ